MLRGRLCVRTLNAANVAVTVSRSVSWLVGLLGATVDLRRHGAVSCQLEASRAGLYTASVQGVG